MASYRNTVTEFVACSITAGILFSLPQWLPAYLSLQPSEELPLRDMFVIFLFGFVMMGLLPLLEKIVLKVHKYLQARSSAGAVQFGVQNEQQYFVDEPEAEVELFDFEVIILRLLAHAGWKGLPLSKIAADLHLDPPFVKSTLRSLHDSGLVTFMDIPVLGTIYYLSRKGREYSVRQGFLFSI